MNERSRPRKSFEERIRELALARGLLDDKPKFLKISSQTTEDVVYDFRKLASMLENDIERRSKGCNLKSPLRCVVFFPTILNPAIATFPDFITHKRDLSVFVGVNINHQAWMNSSPDKRIALLRDNLRASIEKIKKSYLSPEDKAVLLAAI